MGNTLTTDEVNYRLHEAAEKGDLPELQKYLKKGGDLNKLLEYENFNKPQKLKVETATEIDMKYNVAFNQLVDTMAKDTADNELGQKNQTPPPKPLKMNALHRSASRKSNLKMLSFVLNRVYDVDEQDSQGDTALHYVSMFHNNAESVILLLKFKPNINLQNDHGDTALFSAVCCGCDLKVIEWLLRGGANPNISNVDGDTPLHACALRRGIDPLIPGILLRFGGNPNLKNRHGQTPLHVAAESTNNSVLLLLKFNAKVRLRDNNGNRASEVAASEEIRKVLEEEENDLLERTTKTSDLVEAEDTQLLYGATPRTNRSVQNWLNDRQNSFDSSEYDKNGSFIRGDRGRRSEIIYPRRSVLSEGGYSTGRSSCRLSFDKFSGGGGKGVIELPDNKEIIIPPDAMPSGTRLKVTIRPNTENESVTDLADYDFKFDLKINLPGKSLLLPWVQNQGEIKAPPAFSGMSWEGGTSWQCFRELTDDVGSDVSLNFKLTKEKTVPLTKKVSLINSTVIPPTKLSEFETGKSNKDIENIEDEQAITDISSSDDEDEKNTSDSLEDPPNSLLNEKFWARQVIVAKPASDTSGSCDGSDADSYAEMEDEVGQDDDMHVRYKSCVDELEENIRIKHPIDQELATISEETQEPVFTDENPVSPREDFAEDQAELSQDNHQYLTKESTLSLDSGYRDSLDLEEQST
uniref:probable serine/threonine-protein kinase DDB_G0278535 n=1 Tax=Styela clava TaxID=7725 RepID=UPI00193AC6BC|nr:probable serine/threonine-protein kinase DDB_G0278535 [Styela clava]